MPKPHVSILTPSFNQGRFIGDCLRSVASQTYDNIEHIVVDGGSDDETLSILSATEGPVRWVSEPDRGQSHALNKALAMSAGEIIGWVNSDDAYADVRAVEQAVALFDAHPEVGVIYGHTLRIDAGNKALQYMWAPPFADRLLERATCFYQPSVFLRRAILPDPFVREDLRFVMDRDLWLRLLPTTRFRRLNLLVALDRTHAERKVASQAYVEEREAYRRSVHGSTLSPALRKALNITIRLRGLWETPSLARRLQPTIDLHFDSIRAFALRQAMVPQRYQLTSDAVRRADR
jgi:glycosyltransferase involved in cell wall biosynthesis